MEQVGLQADKHRRAQRVEIEDSGGLHNHPHLHTVAVPAADPCRFIQQQIWSWLPWHWLWCGRRGYWRSNAQGRRCSCYWHSCLIILLNCTCSSCLRRSSGFPVGTIFFSFSFSFSCSFSGLVLDGVMALGCLLHVNNHFVAWHSVYEWLQLALYFHPSFSLYVPWNGYHRI